jgi:NIMA (never in mitosis gene a)-related kinase
MDDYRVLTVIGEGSFGRVLLVPQESSNQTFAIKEIRPPKVTAKESECAVYMRVFL